MSTRSLKYFFFFFLFFAINSISEAFQCEGLLSVVSEQHRVPRTVRLMTYNVQNLYVQEGRYIWGSEEEVEVDPKIKEERHTREIARIITETSPDFIVLQEVETWNSLNRFINNYLGGEYAPFMAGDYNKRSLGIALLIKSDLKFHVRMRSVSGLSWTAASGLIEPVFSRELGVFEVFDPESGEVVLGVFGAHFKSHRDRKNDPKSFLKRSQEAQVTAQIVGQFEDAYPNVPYVIAGDFNANLDDPELSPLFENLDISNPIADPKLFRDKAGLGQNTHSYHQDDLGRTVYSQIDMILTSRQLENFIIGLDVYRYKDRSTNAFKPLPNSNEERNENPSDHFPIFVDFAPEAIYSASEIEAYRNKAAQKSTKN